MQACDLDDLRGWLEVEIGSIPLLSHRKVLLEVSSNLDAYVRWPQRAELLWHGCDRRRQNAQQKKYHSYPSQLKAALPTHRFQDRRSNGPAVIAFTVAGGERPSRSNGRGWNIHHLYDGQFPYPDNLKTPLQAVKDPRHFTQSAGLVAVHPIADALADEVAAFAWLLRAESFLRFGYDPDGVFSPAQDGFGFHNSGCKKVWYEDSAALI